MNGLKRRISILLASAMVLTMNTPVLANTEELLSVDKIDVSREADYAADLSAADVITADGELEFPGITLSSWDVWSLSKNAQATDADYSYDISSRTITVKDNADNAGENAGLIVKPKSGLSELVSVNLLNSTSVNDIKVTVSADSSFAGIGMINVLPGDHDRSVIAGEDTLVIKKDGDIYSYVNAGVKMNGSYLVAAPKTIKGAEASTDDMGDIKITLGDVIGVAKIVGEDGSLTIDSKNKDVLHVSGEGTYALILGAKDKAIGARILIYKTLELESETLSVDEASVSSIKGTVKNTVSGQHYEVAAFKDNAKTEMVGSPCSVTDGSFTLNGLSENTSYYLSVRRVSGSLLPEEVDSEGVIIVPSAWSAAVEAQTGASSFEIDTVSGSTLVLSGSGASRTADIHRVILNGEVKYSESADLILKKDDKQVSGNVSWKSSNSQVVSVVSDKGSVAIVETAKDKDTAKVEASVEPNSVAADLTLTVKDEGGSLSINSMEGEELSTLNMLTGEAGTFVVCYPGEMEKKITLSANQKDNKIISKIEQGGSGPVSTVFNVTADKAGETDITINVDYKAFNDQTYSTTLTLPVVVKDKNSILSFNNVFDGVNCKYIKIDTKNASVSAPFEVATYNSSNAEVATISGNGQITPVKAGKVKFTATGLSEDRIAESDELYVVDPEAKMSPSSITMRQGERFVIFANFPENYYKVTGIALQKSSNPAITAVDYKDGALTLLVSDNKLSDNHVNLEFEVTGESAITGEKSVSSIANATVKINKNYPEDGNETPATEAGVEDISKDKFTAYQIGNTFLLWDKFSSATVYFVGGSADPDTVEGDSPYYDYTTVAGTGYTKVFITLKDEYRDITKIPEVAKNGKKINFTLKKGTYVNKTAKVTLKMSDKLPDLSLTQKSGTVYGDTAVFATKDKKNVFASEAVSAIYVGSKTSNTEVEGIDVKIDAVKNTAKIEYSSSAGEQKNGGLLVTADDWVAGASVFVPFKITKAKSNKPSLKFSKTNAILNTEADQTYSVDVFVNGGMVLDDTDYTITGDGTNAEGLSADIEDSKLVITTSEGLNPGTYIFTVGTEKLEYCKSATFKLNVKAKAGKVSYKVKGKLDSLASETCLTVWPDIKNMSGEVTIPDETMNLLESKGLLAAVVNSEVEGKPYILIYKTGNFSDDVVQYIPKGTININKFEIEVAGNKLSGKLSIPVEEGKLTASGTTIDFRGVDAAYGTSAAEAIYIYKFYDIQGKVSSVKYLTFTGDDVVLSSPKAGSLTVSVDNDNNAGLVTVENKNIGGKDYTGSVKVNVAGTESMKGVTAKFKVLGKVK